MSPAETLAKQFHETYERLAPEYGYETRKESAVVWENVPENNKKLMIAVCEELGSELTKELLAARQCARVIAHAWDHDSAPPEWAVKMARQWGPYGETL